MNFISAGVETEDDGFGESVVLEHIIAAHLIDGDPDHLEPGDILWVEGDFYEVAELVVKNGKATNFILHKHLCFSA